MNLTDRHRTLVKILERTGPTTLDLVAEILNSQQDLEDDPEGDATFEAWQDEAEGLLHELREEVGLTDDIQLGIDTPLKRRRLTQRAWELTREGLALAKTLPDSLVANLTFPESAKRKFTRDPVLTKPSNNYEEEMNP